MFNASHLVRKSLLFWFDCFDISITCSIFYACDVITMFYFLLVIAILSYKDQFELDDNVSLFAILRKSANICEIMVFIFILPLLFIKSFIDCTASKLTLLELNLDCIHPGCYLMCSSFMINFSEFLAGLFVPDFQDC